MKDSPLCQRCGAHAETVLHCVRYCTHACNMWKSLGFQSTSFLTAATWVNWFTLGWKPPILTPSLLAFGDCGEPEILVVLPMRISRTFNSDSPLIIMPPSSGTTSRSTPPWHCVTRVVTWHPMRDKDIILNMDGSSIGNPRVAGFEGLFYTRNGSWIHGFAGSIAIGDDLLAELMALYHGLNLAWSKNYHDLTCYSESKNVLQLVATTNNWHNYSPIIKNIKDFLDRDWNVCSPHPLERQCMHRPPNQD